MRLPPIPFLAAALFLGLTLSVHSDTLQPLVALPNPDQPPSETVLLPVSQERVLKAVGTLDELAQNMLEKSGIPGLAISVVYKGEKIYAEGFGKRAAGSEKKVDPDTVFLLASLSKPVGATVVATQVEKGRIGWDSPVREFLPWFDMGTPWVSDQVTVGDLYSHKSGLPDHAGDDLEDLGYDRRTILERLALLPKHSFRTHYAYTNFGLTAAAEAVAVSAGTDWASLADQTIYSPLGMTSTSSRHADYMAQENRAASHLKTDRGYIVTDLRQPDAQSPAGGVSSSANGMALWMQMVLNEGMVGDNKMLEKAALLPAVSPQTIIGGPRSMNARTSTYGYGFGLDVRPTGRVKLSHSGAFTLGASTTLALVPDLDLGIVVLSNAAPSGVPEAIAASFLDRVELGMDSRDWLSGYSKIMDQLTAPVGSLVDLEKPNDPEPPRATNAYLGHYENAYFGSAYVEVEEGDLVLRLGPKNQQLKMEHWNGDVFSVQPFSENQPAGSKSQVRFTWDANSGEARMVIEHLNSEGLGAFERIL